MWTRTLLFFVFGLVLAGVAVGSTYLAFRTRPILFSDGYRNPTVERYQDTVDPIRHWVLIGLGIVMFLFGGASASGQWKTFLLWRNRVPFNQEDVYFHRDIGFFVFSYPWYRFVVSFAFTTLVIALIVAAATHYLYGGIRLGAKRDRFSHAAQVQLSVLLGLFMLVKAVSYWLDRYGLAISDGSLFTGVSYADANAVLPAKNILMIIALICALLFFGNVIRPGWMLPVLGLRPADPVGDPDRRDLAGDRAAVPGQAVGGRQGAPLHRAQHRSHPAGVRHRQGRPDAVLRGDDRLRRGDPAAR